MTDQTEQVPEQRAGASGSGKLWGGRFETETDALVEAYSASIAFDRRLYREDIAGSIAHARMLAQQGIISDADCAAIGDGLRGIEAEISAGTFEFRKDREDIHLNIEAALAERIGEPARRLHTARSRNDQMATDLRMFVRAACDAADGAPRDAAGRAARPRGARGGDRDPGLHAPPAGAAGAARAPPAGLRGDAGARRGALPRGARPRERAAVGVGRPRRGRLSDRSRAGGARARLRRDRGELARRGLGSRLRRRVSRGGGADDGAPLPALRGDRAVGLGGVRTGAARRRVRDRVEHHAPEAQPGTWPSWRAARARARSATSCRR